MKASKIVLIVIVLGLGFVGGYGYGRWYGPKGAEEKSGQTINGRKVLYWQDGMHPWIRSDHPGKCPICNMDLDPVFEDEQNAPVPANHGKVLYYTDPADANYKADAPGLNPETGNDLVPVYEHSAAAMAPGTVHISAEKQQLIGVVFGKPAYAEEHETVRAAGKVTLDERRVSRVTPKINGWIEKVYADFMGDLVKKGQPLVTIYSPDLLASQREYLLAMRAAETMAKSSLTDTQAHQRTMLEAARRRLELLDLTPEQISELERTRQPVKSVTVYAPSSGYVMERNAFPNQRTSPDQSLYTLADLSRVWVVAEVFEYEAPNIRPGQAVTLSFPYAPERAIHGRVAYIQPGLDASTRTLQVRIETPNPGLQLKPDMYLDVLFEQRSPRMLSVPATAVLDTGRRQLVFIHRGDGYMEPREVRIGRRFGDQIQILEGLTENDQIVVSGNFLIDSESQLRGEGSAPGPQAERKTNDQPHH
ncbi:MAG: efflux RND transporter periplasmic adaptor subunit [Bryobacterales bacterium]|nr:efflux RND transporter periplasmic adaptor subunit [Bryobacterales bacterium]